MTLSGGAGVGVTGTFGGGGGLGLGGGLSVVVTGTNATSIDQLTGSGYEVGFDTPIGGASIIGGGSNNPDLNDGYSGIQVSVGPFMPILGLRAGDTNTRGAMLCGG